MDREQLEAAITAQESMRGTIADEIVDTTVAALRRQLADLDAGTGERRRQVSVLFADVSGFTAMSERLDPEDVSSLMNRVWDRLDAVIVEHGGRIDKHIGDALMAIWGATDVHESDPEQAVRAALGLHGALMELRDELDVELRMRVGVNTGPVMLGSVGTTGEFTALGDTVNLASRLEHAAPADGVLVSHDTYRHVKGVFSVTAQEPLSVKGKRRPVRTYVVHGTRPRTFRLGTRGVEGVETQMVGRDREFDRLTSLLADSVQSGTATSLTVVGDAGVGKSRLLYEFEDWLTLRPDDVRLFRARADERHTGVPYFLVRDLFFEHFGIAHDDPPDAAHRCFVHGIRESAPATTPREIALLATLAGLALGPDPDHDGPAGDDADGVALDRDELWAALATYVERVAADTPVVILLEDIHWADTPSLDAVGEIVDRCAGSAVFVLGLARPALFERGELRRGAVRIDLAPLDVASTRRLIDEVLQQTVHVPAEVIDDLTDRTGGNPFFVEELVKMMIDDGTIVANGDEWTFDLARLADAHPPTSITGVLQARIDRLTQRERALLEAASVVGRVFWDRAIPPRNGTEPLPIDETRSVLDSLGSKELAFRQPVTSLADTRQYIFRHALLHDVVYEQILKRERAELHRRVASWLEARGESQAFAGLIAHHYEAAGDPVDAARWRARAGRLAARQLAFAEAADHLAAARDEPGLDPATRVTALADLSEVLVPLARFDEGLGVADELVRITRELGDTTGQAMALLERSNHLTRLGRFEDALDAVVDAERLLDTHGGDTDWHQRALTERGWLELRLGRPDAAVRAGERALSMVPDEPDVRTLRGVHSQLGNALHAHGRLADAEHHLTEALRLSRSGLNRRNEAGDLLNLGILAISRDQHELATRHFADALAIVREIGDRDQEALALNNLGGARVTEGAFDAAVDDLTESIALFEAANAGEHTSETHCLLARAHLGRDDTGTAADEARLALRLAEADRSPEHQGQAWLTLGVVARRSAGRVRIGGVDQGEADCLARGVATLAGAGLDVELRNGIEQLAGIVGRLGDDAGAAELRALATPPPTDG